MSFAYRVCSFLVYGEPFFAVEFFGVHTLPLLLFVLYVCRWPRKSAFQIRKEITTTEKILKKK